MLQALMKKKKKKHSEFLLFLCNGKKFTRITPFWSVKTIAMFCFFNWCTLEFLLSQLCHVASFHWWPFYSHDFSCWQCTLNFLKLIGCCRRSCTSLCITQVSPSWFCHFYIFWPNARSLQWHSRHRKPAVSSEFQLDGLLQQSKVNHGMLLKVHRRALSAFFHFMHNGNIAS